MVAGVLPARAATSPQWATRTCEERDGWAVPHLGGGGFPASRKGEGGLWEGSPSHLLSGAATKAHSIAEVVVTP